MALMQLLANSLDNFPEGGNYNVGTCPVGGLYRGAQEREQQGSQQKGQQPTGG